MKKNNFLNDTVIFFENENWKDLEIKTNLDLSIIQKLY